VPSALDDLVSCVILNIVEFVLHEQIIGAHLVAADQESLQSTRMSAVYSEYTAAHEHVL
jgi:hypothetical protein